MSVKKYLWSIFNMDKKILTQKEAYHAGTDYQFVQQVKMGAWTTYSLFNDPIHMSFVLARYKFCARLLTGKKLVLEVGCGDAPGSPIVAQFVGKLVASDIEERHIKENKIRLRAIKNLEFRMLDICQQIPKEKFDAVYSIDVIEHLDKPLNKPFIQNTVKSLQPNGVCIIGTPNITANKYATARSKIQHINLQSQKSLREQLEKYFHNVFMFSMNDEVLHTGFGNMAHYLFGVGVGVK
jgi:2-polyprenyl-3-methyl-5-hydroxy-6-metoxy-1,4-benzoquinol methylase